MGAILSLLEWFSGWFFKKREKQSEAIRRVYDTLSQIRLNDYLDQIHGMREANRKIFPDLKYLPKNVQKMNLQEVLDYKGGYQSPDAMQELDRREKIILAAIDELKKALS